MSRVSRGQIVLVDFPYSDGAQSKIRPALVVQSDSQNTMLSKTIVAMITGNLRRRSEPTHVFVDPAKHAALGIHGPSLISCINLFTVDQIQVIRSIGSLPMVLQDQVDLALKETLAL